MSENEKYEFDCRRLHADLQKVRDTSTGWNRIATQSQIADMLGVSQAKISRLMSDLRTWNRADNLTIDLFLEICLICESNPHDYFHKPIINRAER